MEKTYKNVGGAHVTLTNQVINRGETIRTEEDLAAIFPMKFQVIQEIREPIEEIVPKKEIEEPVKKPMVLLFKDVTKEFSKAVDAELTIGRKKNSGWFVFDGRMVEEEAINKAPLRRKDVDIFIANIK